MSKLVRYDDRGRLLAYGHELVGGGDPVEMSDADAKRLQADPTVQVTVTAAPKADPAPPDGEREPEAHTGEGQSNDSTETKE